MNARARAIKIAVKTATNVLDCATAAFKSNPSAGAFEVMHAALHAYQSAVGIQNRPDERFEQVVLEANEEITHAARLLYELRGIRVGFAREG